MKYKKGEYRDQYVIAFIRDLDDCQGEINWAKRLSLMLGKGLILLYISDKKRKNADSNMPTVDCAKEKLAELNKSIDLPYVHSYAALQGTTKQIIGALGDLLNGVVAVCRNYDGLLKDFSLSRLAYFVFEKGCDVNDLSQVVLTVNSLKECKEKILWASYFGRFNRSVTHIYYHRYRDEYMQKQLCLNIGFLRKMFRKFNIETLNARSMDTHTMLDCQALRYAEDKHLSLCIFQTTKTKSIIELFTGLSEKKVLKRMQNVPILFLNRRDDLFVMCE